MSKNEYRQQFEEALKQEFKNYDIKDSEEDYLLLTYNDSYVIEEILIDFNEYNVPIKVEITRVSTDEEIIQPSSCHECAFEDCSFYDVVREKCSLDDSTIEKEISEWCQTLFENQNIRVKRIVLEYECFLDLPHYHIYKGYGILLRQSLTVEDIKGLVNQFDNLVTLASK